MDEETLLISGKDGNLDNISHNSTIKKIVFDVENSNSEYLQSLLSSDAEKSWWYNLCFKLRLKEPSKGWEPSYWQSICPYPFCPTYRYIARIVSLWLVGLLVWGIVYSMLGDDAAPGGKLFDIVFLCITADFGGYIFRAMNFPGLIGMLLTGVIFQNLGLVTIHRTYPQLIGILRKAALVVILSKAGLYIKPEDMKRLFFTVLRLGLGPWIVECAFMVLYSHYFLDLPWMWAMLLGCIIAAVSPAVVVPCLFELRAEGYGVAKGIPTVIIAVAAIDDAISVASFGIIHNIIFSKHSLMFNILLGPLSVISGIGFGVLWGVISKYIPEQGDPVIVPLRVLMLLCGGMISMFGSERLGLGGAGPLGVFIAAFVSSWGWHLQGWKIEDNPVTSVFEVFWMLFEPIVFALTGTQIIIAEIDGNVLLISVCGLLAGSVIRIVSTIIIAINTSLNAKEKLCCALSWMAKASVQAAVSPLVVDAVSNYPNSRPEKHYAHLILMTCVMAIVLSAPVGAIMITFLGPRLLTKTDQEPCSGWQKCSRPSLFDVAIEDGDEK